MSDEIKRNQDPAEAPVGDRSIRDLQKTCPGCGEVLQPTWLVCPQCGLRLKPGNDLLPRLIMWLVVLVAFVSMNLVIAKNDPNSASTFSFLFGIPLAYVFGKAVLFRVLGRPLTLGELGTAGFRAGVFVIVAPIVLGAALILLLFAICASSGMFR